MVTVPVLPSSRAEASVIAAVDEALSVVGHSCIAVRGTTHRASPTTLTEAETFDIGSARPERRAEFATGRALAREALAAIGHGATSIRRGATREPLWPEGVTGSISHSGDLCLAAAAFEASVRAIGIDVELNGGIEPGLWPSICSERELRRVERLPVASRADEVARLFSAKEAAFKCQFPITRRWIEFSAVSVSMRGDGGFRVVESTPGLPPLPAMRGAVLLREGVVFALAVTEETHLGACVPPLLGQSLMSDDFQA